MIQLVTEIGPRLGVAPSCAALSLPRATFYRRRKAASRPLAGPVNVALDSQEVANPLIPGEGCSSSLVRPIDPGADAAVVSEPIDPIAKKSIPRALTINERKIVLDTLHEPRFVDLAPAEVWATLLDEGRYLCSERTMYRFLAANREVRERRDQLRHPKYAAPELMATKPNQVWSWDITKLLSMAKWSYFYLYVILDVFSRYVVGWMVAERESAALAERLIDETCERQGIARGELTLHADRGAPMTSHLVAQLLATLGVEKTHSRPHVSNDNPFSEAQFKTLKYRPDFPDRLPTVDAWHAFLVEFFRWYNSVHHHVGLELLTPHDVHFGLAAQRVSARDAVMARAYAAHPERFIRGAPRVRRPPEAVWINPPSTPALGSRASVMLLAREPSSGGPGVEPPASGTEVTLQ